MGSNDFKGFRLNESNRQRRLNFQNILLILLCNFLKKGNWDIIEKTCYTVVTWNLSVNGAVTVYMDSKDA